MANESHPPSISQKKANEVFVRLQAVFKLAIFYEPNNRVFKEQMDALFALIAGILQHDGIVQVDIAKNAIFLNRLRLKFDFATFSIYKFMISEFQEREIGSLTLEPGLTQEEFTRFILFLVKNTVRGEDKFDGLSRELEAAGFPHILIGPVPPTEQVESKYKDAVNMFLLGIYHLEEIFERSREVTNFNLTRRWIQSMFNHIVHNESFVYGLVNIKNYDEYTLNHSVNVCILSLALGRRLGLSRHDLSELGISAFLHDMGKPDIPSEILDKPAVLNDAERAIIEKHSSYGAERLVEMAALRGLPDRAIQVALEHHVRNDMGGYPKYFRKKNISLFSKIVKIADYYDALTTKRIFRDKIYTKKEALILMLEKGEQEFDPLLLKAFVSLIGVYPVGSLVYLNTGEIGIVTETSPHASFAQRPIVKIITAPNGDKTDGPEIDLTEVDPETRRFTRTIVKSLDPDKYGVQVADFFLVRAS
jgi:putative nucleotidyltransferase with HDIG domain